MGEEIYGQKSQTNALFKLNRQVSNRIESKVVMNCTTTVKLCQKLKKKKTNMNKKDNHHFISLLAISKKFYDKKKKKLVVF